MNNAVHLICKVTLLERFRICNWKAVVSYNALQQQTSLNSGGISHLLKLT